MTNSDTTLRGGFSGAIVLETGGAAVTSLSTNPQEDLLDGIRHLPVTLLLGQQATRYNDVLGKYPPNFSVKIPGWKQ